MPPAVIVTVTFRPVTRGCGLEQNCHYVGPFCALLTPQCEVHTWSHEARLTPGSSARCSPFYATDVTTADCNLRLSQEYILRTDHSLVIPRQGFLRADMNHVGRGGEGLGLDSGTHVRPVAPETTERDGRGTNERPRVRASPRLGSDGPALRLAPVYAPFFPHWGEERRGDEG